VAAATATTRRRSALQGRALWLVSALALSACGGGAPPKSAPRLDAKPKAPDHAVDYAPAAGLRWLLFARPAKIFADPALSSALASVLPAQRLDAYAASTGVDLRRVPAGIVAGYDLGLLYVAEVPQANGSLVRERFASRLSEGGMVKRVSADVYRVSGTEGDEPRALVTVENRMVALASGDVTLARVAEAYAARRLKSPSALHGAALSTLPAPTDDVLIAGYAPGPFDETSLVAAPRLLAATLALGVTAVPAADPTSLSLTVTLAGEWAADTGPADELLRVWSELSISPTGRLLGLDSARDIRAHSSARTLTLTLSLPLGHLLQGLRSITFANVPEIFDVNRVTPSAAPPPNE
jgi:hypothetical protein